MPTEPDVPTVSQVVHRAATVCDPEGDDEGLPRLLERFEDHDEPITAETDVESMLAESTRTLDPEGERPAIRMAAAEATYLAHRRTQISSEREELLRLAARAEFRAIRRPPWRSGSGPKALSSRPGGRQLAVRVAVGG